MALPYHGSCARPWIGGATAGGAVYPTGSRRSGRFAGLSFSTTADDRISELETGASVTLTRLISMPTISLCTTG